jgi:hypothetical protein
MELRSPVRLGGRFYLEAVSVGRRPESEAVRDCPGCGGYCCDDEWHLVATVYSGGTGTRERHHYCSDGCLGGWLRTAPDA